MKLKYIGTDDPDDNVAECTVYGITFTKGEAAEVKDEAVAAKLAGNPTFEVVKAGGRAAAE